MECITPTYHTLFDGIRFASLMTRSSTPPAVPINRRRSQTQTPTSRRTLSTQLPDKSAAPVIGAFDVINPEPVHGWGPRELGRRRGAICDADGSLAMMMKLVVASVEMHKTDA
jgi:hypothetical protein